jgi:hypothetical protein
MAAAAAVVVSAERLHSRSYPAAGPGKGELAPPFQARGSAGQEPVAFIADGNQGLSPLVFSFRLLVTVLQDRTPIQGDYRFAIRVLKVETSGRA